MPNYTSFLVGCMVAFVSSFMCFVVVVRSILAAGACIGPAPANVEHGD